MKTEKELKDILEQICIENSFHNWREDTINTLNKSIVYLNRGIVSHIVNDQYSIETQNKIVEISEELHKNILKIKNLT